MGRIRRRLTTWLSTKRTRAKALADPYGCVGCHTGGWADFDHFCDALNVQDEETGEAFAAWLGGSTEWDGDYEHIK